MFLTRLIVRSAIAFGVLLASLTGVTYGVGVVFGQPAIRQIQTFLIPPNCPQPCWMGIRPGITTTDEARALLHESPWVNRLYEMNLEAPGGFPGLTWDWTPQAPALINSGAAGSLTFYRDRVVEIKVRLNLRFGDVQNALGQPEDVLHISAPVSWPSVFEYNQYPDQYLEFDTAYLCPVVPTQRFNAQVTFQVSLLITAQPRHDEAVCQ